MFAMMHCMRFTAYFATSLPGANERCLPPIVNEQPGPAHWYDAFTTKIHGNCGDLIFSGHVLECFLYMHFFTKYGEAAFQIPNQVHRVAIALLWCLVVWQLVCVLSARNHYSVDVVISCWIVPLFIFWFNRAVLPKDIAYKTEFEDCWGGCLQRIMSAKCWHEHQ